MSCARWAWEVLYGNTLMPFGIVSLIDVSGGGDGRA